MTDLKVVAQRALNRFSKAPGAFVLLQTPMFALTLLDFFLSDYLEDRIAIWGLVSFVIFGAAWGLSSALTFVAVEQRRSGLPGTLVTAWPPVARKLRELIVAVMSAHLATFLGLLLLVLPGIWALVNFLFEPLIAVTSPPQKVTDTLKQSSRIVKERGFWYYFVLTFTYLLFVFAMDWILKSGAHGLFRLSKEGFVLLAITTFCNGVVGSWFDIVLADLFLDRAQKAN